MLGTPLVMVWEVMVAMDMGDMVATELVMGMEEDMEQVMDMAEDIGGKLELSNNVV